MTFTTVFLVTRKTGIPPSAFKQHWENTHIPLLKAIVGYDFPLSHTRHYIERDLSTPEYPANILYGQQEDFTFDAVAVFTFANRAHWER
ncbi:hypothetical protein K469DRAFT_809488 [Zopfia rhizophila CBS 207.26]|uniref:EthD domain-containing protein n=1 Tax=Zopfia rhizophila CBS 207.26 TaxID=1314779 RepID=A0A6A6DFZ8_9PEZI|nr:hypothetical protein K469DRAFT_809488 [Zopfia rhizophila CBS 207.26]